MKSTKTFRPAELYPPFLAYAEKLAEACRLRGAQYWATSGFRSWEEQDRLFSLGRTVANVDATPQKPMGGIVTNARGGQSLHNLSIAIDFALDKDTLRDGLQPDWRLEAYRILAEEAKKLGLESGFWWTKIKDGPHVELPLARHGLTTLGLQKIYRAGGIPGLWKELDKYQW